MRRDRWIWIVICCILAVGVSVTHYTGRLTRESRAAEESMAGDSPEMAAAVPGEAEAAADPGDGVLADFGAPAAGAENGTGVSGEGPGAPGSERIMVPNMGAIEAAGGQNGNTGTGGENGQESEPETEPEEIPESGAAGGQTGRARSRMNNRARSAVTAPDETETQEETDAQTDGGGSGTYSPVSSSADGFISPLDTGRTGPLLSSSTTDYRQRLKDLDTQIKRMRREETDTNAYSRKAQAQTETRMWEGEMNLVYGALRDGLSEKDALALAKDQQDWLSKREIKAAETTGKPGIMDGVEYAVTMANLTRDRAYELVDWYDQMRGVPVYESASSWEKEQKESEEAKEEGVR